MNRSMLVSSAMLALVGAAAGCRQEDPSVTARTDKLAPSVNIAAGKPAEQSSTIAPDWDASRAVDGNTDGDGAHRSLQHTGLDQDPWWQVDLRQVAPIDQIVVWNRTDCCQDRLSNWAVYVSANPFPAGVSLEGMAGVAAFHPPFHTTPEGWTERKTVIDVGGLSGRYVRVAMAGVGYLHVAEVEVFSTVPAAANPGFYTMTPIEYEGELIELKDINNAGVAVGTVTKSGLYTSDGITHAFTHDDTHGLVELTVPPPNLSRGEGINDSGQIAGTLTTTRWYNWTEHGFRMSPGGVVDVLTPPVFYGQGINDAGQVTGQGYDSDGLVTWRSNGTEFHSLRFPDGADYAHSAVGLGIGPGGEVAGYTFLATGPIRAFIYRNSTFVDLNSLISDSNWVLQIAYATNGHQVVGVGQYAGANRGFRLNVDTGELRDLRDSQPRDINANGNVTGCLAGAGVFFFSDQTGVVDLRTKVDPAPGWIATCGYGLNDHDVIVGTGLLPLPGGGLRELGFKITPPNPGGDSPLALRVDGVVDVGDGKLVAIFSYDNTGEVDLHPGTSAAYVDGILIPSPYSPPPTVLPPGNHVGAYLPSFSAGEEISWKVDGQTVKASASLPHLAMVPMGDGQGVQVGDTMVAIDELVAAECACAKPPTDPDLEKLKSLFTFASDLASYYSSAKSALDTVKALADALDIWKQHDVKEDFAAIVNTLVFIEWKESVTDINDRLKEADTAVFNFNDDKCLDCRDANGGPTESERADTRNAVLKLADRPRFLRAAKCRPSDEWSGPGCDEASTDGAWKTAILARPKIEPEGGIYDWRRALPALTAATAFRILILGASDHDFRWNGHYDSDLDAMRTALLTQYDLMIGGIHCATGLSGSYCADIYTGTFTSHEDAAGDPSKEVILRRLRNELIQKLPLFELRRLIDTLWLYAHREKDLTETSQRISAAGSPSLCLDGPGDGSDLPMQLEMSPCSQRSSQAWTYDRVKATVKGTFNGLCIGVAGGEAAIQGPLTFPTPHPISWPLADVEACNDTNAQKWTYDAEQQVLLNALGTVLDIRWGTLAVQARPRDGEGNPLLFDGMLPARVSEKDLGSQRWLANQPLTLNHLEPSTCGALGPGEGLAPDQVFGTCDGRFRMFVVGAGLAATGRTKGTLIWEENITFDPPAPPGSPQGLTIDRWQTEAADEEPGALIMQADGNLVLYDLVGAPLWSSNTWGHPGAALALEANGDLVLHDQNGSVLWEVRSEHQYREHRPPPSLLWHDAETGQLVVWLLDEFRAVRKRLVVSQRCDRASGCATNQQVIATMDLDGNGVLDIVWHDRTHDQLSVWLLDRQARVIGTVPLSRGLQSPQCNAICAARTQFVGALDADHDGITDLLWNDSQTFHVSAWLLSPSGTVTGVLPLPFGYAEEDLTSSPLAGPMDVDGDGSDEILQHDLFFGPVTGRSLDGTVHPLSWQCNVASGCSQAWRIIGRGDFNSDRIDDLLWYNPTSGEMSVWLTDGQGNVTGSRSLAMRCDTVSHCADSWKLVGLLNLH